MNIGRASKLPMLLPYKGSHWMRKPEKSNHNLQYFLAHDLIDIMLSQKVLKYVVVGLILLRTYIMFHGDIKPQIILQCGRSCQLADLQYSRKIGNGIRNTEKYNWGCCPT